MKIFFVLPVYNDWDNLKVLSKQIKEISILQNWRQVELIIVNDASTQELTTSPNPFNLKSTIINLFSNQGSQRSINIGLFYLNEQISDYDYVIIMDSDGEDKASDVVHLINEAKKNEQKKIVFASRAKRNEGFIFSFFYKMYKILFRLFTGEKISVGNFSCIPKNIVKRVLSISDIWAHFSAGIIKSKLEYTMVSCDKGERFSGTSKMKIGKLFMHGITSMSVYMESIVLRFFLTSLVGMFVITIFIGIIFYIKLLTNITILGWASTMTLGLTIIFVILLLICFLSLLTLLGKNLNPNLPTKNKYKSFILNEQKLSE